MIPAFFKLIRVKNLAIIAFCQILFKYFFINKSGVDFQLTNFYFLILLFALLFIAAAGYIINDIYDLESDKINKPKELVIGKHISEKLAMRFYILFNFIGLGLATFLSYKINHLNFGSLFLLLAFGLLKYSQSWKKIFILKNVIVALLVSLSILILGIYDVYAPINISNAPQQLAILSIIFDYFLFAFLVNIIREVIKDIEDEIGDKKRQTKSLISVLGLKNTRTVLIFLNSLLVVAIAYYATAYFRYNNLAFLYMISLVFLPSLIYYIFFIKAKTITNYTSLTRLLKLIMIFGIGSIAVISILNT
ncbi:MAG: UbiA family prenyltransferase [Flavobacteriaceae bacterium]